MLLLFLAPWLVLKAFCLVVYLPLGDLVSEALSISEDLCSTLKIPQGSICLRDDLQNDRMMVG